MQTYAVQHQDIGETSVTEFFIVQADDREHAVEQCRNAYPDTWIIRVFVEDNS